MRESVTGLATCVPNNQVSPCISHFMSHGCLRQSLQRRHDLKHRLLLVESLGHWITPLSKGSVVTRLTTSAQVCKRKNASPCDSLFFWHTVACWLAGSCPLSDYVNLEHASGVREAAGLRDRPLSRSNQPADKELVANFAQSLPSFSQAAPDSRHLKRTSEAVPGALGVEKLRALEATFAPAAPAPATPLASACSDASTMESAAKSAAATLQLTLPTCRGPPESLRSRKKPPPRSLQHKPEPQQKNQNYPIGS